MGKSRNRNQQRLKTGKPLEVSAKSTLDEKPFVGSNVFTAEDDAIIKSILVNPDWSVEEVKAALPYNHSLKNVINHLGSFCSAREIEEHMTPPESSTPEHTWADHEERALKEYFGHYGPHWEGWATILPERTSAEIAAHARVLDLPCWAERPAPDAAKLKSVPDDGIGKGRGNNPGPRWTPDDDDLLRAGWHEYGPDPEIWKDILSVPRTRKAIATRANKLGITHMQPQPHASVPVPKPHANTPEPAPEVPATPAPTPAPEPTTPVTPIPAPTTAPVTNDATLNTFDKVRTILDAAAATGLAAHISITCDAPVALHIELDTRKDTTR